MIAPGTIGWALETFVATTLLMLLVLAIRAPVRRAFGPHIAYALWLMPVARLLLPRLPEGWNEQAGAPVAAAGEVITIYVVEPLGGAPQHGAEASFGWLMALLLVWGIGAAAFLGYHLFAHSRFCRRLLARARADRTVAGGRVRVIETDAAHGPLAFGIWRKYVAFPRDFSERYDEVERDLALAHELGHHARGDLIANWVALVVLALHWFNPVAWRAFRAFRADQEMACDALVLAGRAQALRHAYGRAIVKSAHGGAVSAACHLHTINELKGRLRMLSNTGKKSPIRLTVGAVSAGALSLAALGLTASGTQAAERIKEKVESTIGVDLSAQDIPAPPAPVEAPDAADLPEPPEALASGAPPAPVRDRHVEKHVYRYSDGKPGKDGRKRVVVVRTGQVDGKDLDIDVDIDVDAIEASIPEIRDGKCGGGDRPPVVHRQNGAKSVTIICTDRIERMAAMSAKMAERHSALAAQHGRLGIASALAGMRGARAAVQAQPDLSPERRAAALRGLDEAIRELEQERADH